MSDEEDLRENPCALCPCCEADEGNDICNACATELEQGDIEGREPDETPSDLPENFTSMIWDCYMCDEECPGCEVTEMGIVRTCEKCWHKIFEEDMGINLSDPKMGNWE